MTSQFRKLQRGGITHKQRQEPENGIEGDIWLQPVDVFDHSGVSNASSPTKIYESEELNTNQRIDQFDMAVDAHNDVIYVGKNRPIPHIRILDYDGNLQDKIYMYSTQNNPLRFYHIEHNSSRIYVVLRDTDSNNTYLNIVDKDTHDTLWADYVDGNRTRNYHDGRGLYVNEHFLMLIRENGGRAHKRTTSRRIDRDSENDAWYDDSNSVYAPDPDELFAVDNSVKGRRSARTVNHSNTVYIEVIEDTVRNPVTWINTDITDNNPDRGLSITDGKVVFIDNSETMRIYDITTGEENSTIDLTSKIDSGWGKTKSMYSYDGITYIRDDNLNDLAAIDTTGSLRFHLKNNATIDGYTANRGKLSVGGSIAAIKDDRSIYVSTLSGVSAETEGKMYVRTQSGSWSRITEGKYT
jgi:hypothetical protein